VVPTMEIIAEAMAAQEIDALGRSNSNGGSTFGFTNGFVHASRHRGKRSAR
jgi:hypothetical protein